MRIYDQAHGKWVPGEIVEIDKQYKVKPNESDQIVVVKSDDIRPSETKAMSKKENQIAKTNEISVLAASELSVPRQRVYQLLHDLVKEARDNADDADKGKLITMAVTR